MLTDLDTIIEARSALALAVDTLNIQGGFPGTLAVMRRALRSAQAMELRLIDERNAKAKG